MSNVYIHWCNSVLFCFCYCDKILWPKQEFILTYSSRERVHNALESMGAGTKAKLANHISSAYRRIGVDRCPVWWVYKLTAHPQWRTSSSGTSFPESSRTSPKPAVAQVFSHRSSWRISHWKPHSCVAFLEVGGDLDFVFNSTSYQLRCSQTNPNLVGV